MTFQKSYSKSKSLELFTNEIIDPVIFREIYNNEILLIKFNSKITTESGAPFATFPIVYRNLANIKEGDIAIIQMIQLNKIFEFLSIIRKWGKFTIPSSAVNTLNLKNHFNVEFRIIKQSSPDSYIKEGTIDLMKIDSGEGVLYRNKNFITIFKKSKIPVTLPRFIKITPDLIELLFLIHGDGHYKDKLYFVNKNPDLHKFVIKTFKNILKIPSDTWRARLLFNNTSDAELAKEEWKNILDLKSKQFYPLISKTELNTSNKGNLRIVIDKTIISSVFRYLFKMFSNPLDKNAFYALNGLLYAEGGVGKNKKGLHKITLSFNQNEKDLFFRILKNSKIIKLTRIEQNSRFCISNWENLYEFFKLFYLNQIVPFDINNERCKKAVGGFLEHSYTKTASKYLTIITQKEDFTLKELANKIGYRPDSILNTLKKKQYHKFININGKGINRNPLIISINNAGKEFLKIIDNLEKIYNDRFK